MMSDIQQQVIVAEQLEQCTGYLEQRTHERQRVRLNAKVVFNNRASIIDCVVRDMSEAGASLLLAHPVPLPSDFELRIPSKGRQFSCEVKWSAFWALGVKFA